MGSAKPVAQYSPSNPSLDEQSLTSIVQALDNSILADTELGSDLFAQLLALQRKLGLVHGDRPTCPFLRPHIVARSQYNKIKEAAEIIAKACEKLVLRALQDDELFAQLGLTPAEAKMARIYPGYSPLCTTSRLDAYVTDKEFKFLEYNAESPAGVGDQMQLEQVLFPLRHNRDFISTYAHWCPQPHRQLLKALMQAYREWGGEEERPCIAIVDWKGVATGSEFRILSRYFDQQGCQTVIVDPRDLVYDGQRLRAFNRPIDILYKRVIIHEFLERLGEDHALARAYSDDHVFMANSFRSKMAHKKASFAILRDPQYRDLFDTAETKAIEQHIPWTQRVERGTTVFEGIECDLLRLLKNERQRFVLKPNDDYGGHGVFLGWETDESGWQQAIEIALTQPYVVQERAPVKRVSMPMFDERVEQREMLIDFNPFLFNNEVEGALVRLSCSSLLNVTAGGGQTALLVLEGL